MVDFLTIDEIQRNIDTNWEPGFGPVSAAEALFIQENIKARRPDVYVEIGVASGISTGLAAHALAKVGARRLVAIDINPSFMKAPTGRKYGNIYKGRDVSVEINTPYTSLDIDTLLGSDQIGMAFVDGSHQHPWPVIDLMMLIPRLQNNAVVAFHDLDLFKKYLPQVGVGPKYLYDQFDDSTRTRGSGPGGSNIFTLKLNGKPAAYERQLMDALFLPWTLSAPFSLSTASKVFAMLEKHYSPQMKAVFEKTYSAFMKR